MNETIYKESIWMGLILWERIGLWKVGVTYKEPDWKIVG